MVFHPPWKLQGMEDLVIDVLARDSFRKWKKAVFRYTDASKLITLSKKQSSVKPFGTYRIQRISLSLSENTLGITKKKKTPIFLQFESSEEASRIYKMLSVGFIYFSGVQEGVVI